MSQIEHRRFVRYDVHASVELATDGWRATFETGDLGAGGCRITLEQPLEKGVAVAVRLTSERSRACPQGQARVAWASRAAPYHVGLAFSDPLAEQVIAFMQDLLGQVPIRTGTS